jgi:hypothetical protein
LFNEVKSKSGSFELEFDETAVLIRHIETNRTISGRLIEARYPDFKKAINTHNQNNDNLAPKFNPKYLADFDAAIKILHGNKTELTPYFQYNGSASPAFVDFHDSDIFGLVLPMDYKKYQYEFPGWVLS